MENSSFNQPFVAFKTFIERNCCFSLLILVLCQTQKTLDPVNLSIKMEKIKKIYNPRRISGIPSI